MTVRYYMGDDNEFCIVGTTLAFLFDEDFEAYVAEHGGEAEEIEPPEDDGTGNRLVY